LKGWFFYPFLVSPGSPLFSPPFPMVFFWQSQLSFIPCEQREKIALVTTVLSENCPGCNGPWWKSHMLQLSSVKIAHVAMVLSENRPCRNGPRWKLHMSQWSSLKIAHVTMVLGENRPCRNGPQWRSVDFLTHCLRSTFLNVKKVNCGINWSFPLSHKKRPPAFGRRVLFNSFSRHFVSRNFQFYLQNKDTQVLMYDEPKYMYIGRCKLM
jgi:hypothetical protein